MSDTSQPLYHGGALDQAMAQYGGDVQDWLDLSTGINPHHYPITQVEPSSWTQLPQASALDGLLTAASKAYNCKENQILAVNGTQNIIETLPFIMPKSIIAILSPTYQEHAQNWTKYGHKVMIVDNVKQAMQADHLLIVNPNNPTGKTFTPDELQVLRAYFDAKNGFLIIDEAFIDMTPELSMSEFAGQKGLIILRSFGKFFGLAGVRIGFILAEDEILQKMRMHIGLWDMAGMAIDIATQALNDTVWQQNMRQTLTDEMKSMCQILQQNSFKIIGQTDLFCLVEMSRKNLSAYKYFDKLATHHILTRKFMDDDKILRFGLATQQQQNIFSTKLKQICEELAL